MQVPFCQSCSMPMKPSDFGTNADGSVSREYCRFCYVSGHFTEPSITVEQMVKKCSAMMAKMGLPEAQIKEAANLIPKLKRWRKA